ncbi:DUF4259 domain-containing protein [Lentzea alba]|uniref:DUF4259 domain-containing protein n=1 Tax=Lentzea alba TaxID=2714351 RepID=UPI0039BFCFC8
MGTFGVGPFDSDGAQDLLEDLASRAPQNRAEVLAALLRLPIADPESVGREVFADEVVAAVAVIVTGSPEVPAAEVPRLAELAAAALPIVTESWGQGWTSPADAAAASDTVKRLSEALRTIC